MQVNFKSTHQLKLMHLKQKIKFKSIDQFKINALNIANEIKEHTPILSNAPNSPNESYSLYAHNSHNAHNAPKSPNVHNAPLSTPRIIHRMPKLLIDIDENILRPMHNKMSERVCRRIVNKI